MVRERAVNIEKDRQFAIWTQAQINKGLDPDLPPPQFGELPTPGDASSSSPPSYDDLSPQRVSLPSSESRSE